MDENRTLKEYKMRKFFESLRNTETGTGTRTWLNSQQSEIYERANSHLLIVDGLGAKERSFSLIGKEDKSIHLKNAIIFNYSKL